MPEQSYYDNTFSRAVLENDMDLVRMYINGDKIHPYFIVEVLDAHSKKLEENTYKKMKNLLINTIYEEVTSLISAYGCNKFEEEDIEFFESTLKHIDPTINNNYLMRLVCFNNQIEHAKILLEDGRVDVLEQGATIRDYPAVSIGGVEYTNLSAYEEAGEAGYGELTCIIEAHMQEEFLSCFTKDNLDIPKFRKYLPYMDMEECGWLFLKKATMYGYTEIVSMLMETGEVDPLEERYGDSLTAYVIAKEKGHKDILEIYQRYINNSLENAINQKYTEIVQLLEDRAKERSQKYDEVIEVFQGDSAAPICQSKIADPICQSKIADPICESKIEEPEPQHTEDIQEIRFSADEYTWKEVDGEIILTKKIPKIHIEDEFEAYTVCEILEEMNTKLSKLYSLEDRMFIVNFEVNEI